MDPERWNRIRSITEAAFGRLPTERSAFLDDACGADPELREDVEALLRSDERPTGAFDPPGHGALFSRLAVEVEAGAELGDFVIERELGAGGMGVVYAARQKQPSRRVALKRMRSDAASPEALRRFALESEVLARLQHPSIAQIFSAGLHEEDGRRIPWFAMELVEDARSITGYARDEQLSTEERLDLFLEICGAVHFGHQKGVIHRDIKAGNVLVGQDGRPKIIDFGIARSLGSSASRVTEDRTTDGILGTLQSMSPEQAAGDPDLDVRSDVYSLGVLLFELLTDATPHDFRGKAVHEVARIVVEDPARSPRAIVPALSEDLEIIVLKALEKERQRRYASVHELASDLLRYRNQQPIVARRASAAYQLSLFARRHRALVGASTLFVASLAATTVWSWQSMQEARAAETLAEEERATANALRAEEAEARALAEELFRSSLDLNEAFVRDFALRVQRLPGSTQVSHDMTEATTRNLEFLADVAGAPGPVHEALARAMVRFGGLQGSYARPSLGEDDLARQSYESALEIASELQASDPDSIEHLLLVAFCKGHLGQWHLGRGELDRARSLLGSQCDDLHRAIEQGGGSADARRTLAGALGSLGSVAGLQGEHHVALEHFEGARALYEGLFDEFPEDASLATAFAMQTGQRGTARFRNGDAGGIEDLKLECEILEDVLGRAPNHAPARWTLAETRIVTCQLLLEQEAFDEARRYGTGAVELVEALLAEEPESIKYRRLLYNAAFLLGLANEAEAEAIDDTGESRALWGVANEWFERASALCAELAREGALAPQDADHPERIREHLERARTRSAM